MEQKLLFIYHHLMKRKKLFEQPNIFRFVLNLSNVIITTEASRCDANEIAKRVAA